MDRIYLDHSATTPIAPEVREAMEPWLTQEFGNPSSLHEEGRQAKNAIDAAREHVSTALGCRFGEVLFTGTGTEAANMAIVGAALANHDPHRKRVLLGAAEHHCVLHTHKHLERLGYTVDCIPVNRYARVLPEALEPLLGDDVLLVSVMHANNELGTINSIPELAERSHRVGALFHSDIVQSYLQILFRTSDLGADLASASSHKVNGPKGVGALFVRSGTQISPLISGGGQEREMRAGTENVAAIVGFGVAATLCANASGRQACRDAFIKTLAACSTDWKMTVDKDAETLPSIAHIRFPGISAESMLIRLDRMGIAASSGAACSSGSLEPSHVLLACGFSVEEASEGLRFSFGLGNTVEEAEAAAERVANAADAIKTAR